MAKLKGINPHAQGPHGGREDAMIDMIDAAKQMELNASEEERIALRICMNLDPPEGKHTLAWARKMMRQRSEADLQGMFAVALKAAITAGDVEAMMRLKDVMPYTVSKAPAEDTLNLNAEGLHITINKKTEQQDV